MIKYLIKIITHFSLFLTVCFGLYVVHRNVFSLPSRIIELTKVENNIIPVALPYDATVTLKINGKISGKITEFDQQQSEITVQRGSQSKKIVINDIDKVEFGKEVKLINSREPVIRGGDDDFDPNTIQTWQEPLSHFKITNATDGKAEVILSNVSKGKLRGIRSVSQTNTYVVDELSFNHDDNHIILTVIPYSE